jgi:hypothetical protein
MSDVAAVQDAVQRDWEINFDRSNGSDPPSRLTVFLDSAAVSFFDRILGKTHGYDGSQPVKTRNRDIVFHERFRALFRPPIEEVTVYDFKGLCGDLGAALARFPKLRRVELYCGEELSGPTEADWAQLCTRMQSFPHLEEVELGGAWMTDAAIAPLAGNPHLRKITISCGRLTAKCANTFASIPHLAELAIEDQSYGGNTWPWEEDDKEAIRSALPAVSITFP